MIYLTLTKYGYFCAIGERVQTGTQIYRQRRVQQFYWNVDGLRGTPVHTPGKLDRLCRFTVHT